MSKLHIAGRTPDNIRLPFGVHAVEYDADLYNIASRLKEIHRGLLLVALEPPRRKATGQLCHWAVWQVQDNGDESLVFMVEELDQRVLDRAAEIVAVPIAERIRQIELQEQREERQRDQDALDRAYEDWGGQMRHELHKNGFIHEPLPSSYRLLNRTARRAGRKA